MSAAALTFLTQIFLLFSADGRCLSRHRKVQRGPAHKGGTDPGHDNGDFDYNFGTTAIANNTSSISVDEVARVFRVCPDGQPPWIDEDVEVGGRKFSGRSRHKFWKHKQPCVHWEVLVVLCYTCNSTALTLLLCRSGPLRQLEGTLSCLDVCVVHTCLCWCCRISTLNTPISIIPKKTASFAHHKTSGLALWSKFALLNPEKTERYLFYLGFINVHDGTGRHRCFRQEVSSHRSVLRCCVVGAPGVGKSSVMRSLAQKLWSPDHSSPKAQQLNHAVTTNCGHAKVAAWVDAGATVRQSSTFLVMTEVPAGTEAEFFANDKLVCDVVLLLFDARQADSLAHINKVVKTCVPHSIPCVCANNKSDLLPNIGTSKNKSGPTDVVLASARTFCKRNGIAGQRSLEQEFPFMHAANSTQDARKLYKTLVLYSQNPKSLRRKPCKHRFCLLLLLCDYYYARLPDMMGSPLTQHLACWNIDKHCYTFVATSWFTQE